MNKHTASSRMCIKYISPSTFATVPDNSHGHIRTPLWRQGSNSGYAAESERCERQV